jgi:hypothetical protein
VRKVREELSADDPQVAPAERRIIRAGKEQTQKAAGERKRRAPRTSAKLTPDQVAEIRVDPRNGQEIATDYGVHKSQVSRIKANLTHVDPGYAPGLAGLRRAWNVAGAAEREEFLCWLWSEHPAMIRAVITEPRAIERRSVDKGQRTPEAIVGAQQVRRISGDRVRRRVRQPVA